MSGLTIIAPGDGLSSLISAIATGSDAGLEDQLIDKSKQPNILKYTPNDAAKRFGDHQMLDKWRAGGREIHWLLGRDNDLAGIIWYGLKPFPIPSELPEVPKETLAIRLYDGYTGHKLAVPFMRQSLAIHVKSLLERGQAVPGLWLQTDLDNPAALATYAKLGYGEAGRDHERVTMFMPSSEVIALATGK